VNRRDTRDKKGMSNKIDSNDITYNCNLLKIHL
jgi:hypothetical protein